MTETPKRRRLTDEEKTALRATVNGSTKRTPSVMAAESVLELDHDQAREDRKALARELRSSVMYRRNDGDGALCWCGPEDGPCYVFERDPDCERRTRLLAEVGE
jgi:hypothetical protein